MRICIANTFDLSETWHDVIILADLPYIAIESCGSAHQRHGTPRISIRNTSWRHYICGSALYCQWKLQICSSETRDSSDLYQKHDVTSLYLRICPILPMKPADLPIRDTGLLGSLSETRHDVIILADLPYIANETCGSAHQRHGTRRICIINTTWRHYTCGSALYCHWKLRICPSETRDSSDLYQKHDVKVRQYSRKADNGQRKKYVARKSAFPLALDSWLL